MEDSSQENGVAIIGMSGRFPKAHSIEQFWQNLCEGKECISHFEDQNDLVPHRGILENIDLFDAAFFDIAPLEAELIDPQQRLFLECVWESIEQAGYNPFSYEGKIGVYGTCSDNTYLMNHLLPHRKLCDERGEYLLALGNRPDFITTRASYKLNLRGPSMAVQTACSSSLVAVCMACSDLLSYQADMVVAGGMSIAVPQERGYKYQEGMIYSPDGKCKPFDAAANGTVASNGGGAVLLKRLQDALEDGDTIYATIQGFALNNDGSQKVGYSAPSVQGQVDVIQSSLEFAEFTPDTIDYVEAHGTGTILGDPIEIAALTQAFGHQGSAALGSVKGNIGHLLESAGIAGLIKSALMLHHKKIPPSINYHTPNPHIQFEKTPFHVNTSLCDWEKRSHPRRSTVSSFGIGGTNAHVALEEAPLRHNISEVVDSQKMMLSARSLKALELMKERLATYLEDHPELSINDVAHTLKVGRATFEHSQSWVVSSLSDFVNQLRGAEGKSSKEECEVHIEGKRIPLPTYPFERKRFWIERLDVKEVEEELATKSFTTQEQVFERLSSLYCDILGVQNIAEEDDFFDLGGDSLDIVTLSGSIEKIFGLKLPIDMLMKHTQIIQLARYIYEGNSADQESVCCLKEGSGLENLVLVHPIEGHLFCYRELIEQLNFNGSIYGISASASFNETSMEELAKHYVQLIEEKNLNSITLVGMSFGGIVAFEMAKHMSVENVVMMDSFRPDADKLKFKTEDEVILALIELLERKTLPHDYLEKTTHDQRMKHLISSLKMDQFSESEKKAIGDHLLCHSKALMHYQPKPYSGRVTFFEAKARFIREENHSIGEDWRPLIQGEYTLIAVKGDHQTFLKSPHVEQLALELIKHI